MESEGMGVLAGRGMQKMFQASARSKCPQDVRTWLFLAQCPPFCSSGSLKPALNASTSAHQHACKDPIFSSLSSLSL